MATTHQITSVETNRLILGNFAISTSATSGAVSYTHLTLPTTPYV